MNQIQLNRLNNPTIYETIAFRCPAKAKQMLLENGYKGKVIDNFHLADLLKQYVQRFKKPAMLNTISIHPDKKAILQAETESLSAEGDAVETPNTEGKKPTTEEEIKKLISQNKLMTGVLITISIIVIINILK